MQDIEQNLENYLLAWEPLIQLLDKDSAGVPRIYPQHMPQGKNNLPAIVYHEIDSQSLEGLSGSVGYAQPRIQFDCIAEDVSIARRIREEVRQALQNFRGFVSGQKVHGASVQTRTSRFDQPINGSDRGRYIRIIDLLFTHVEPT